MKVFGKMYSESYDLLYNEKDYSSEVQYIVELIAKYHPKAKSILDLGCGSGSHDILLAERGFDVTGIDFSSEMIKIANNKKGKSTSLSFVKGDIRSILLKRKFDIVISLFHVFSYLTSNEDIVNTLKNANTHLNKNGLLIFDYWYGPGVLTQQPSVKVKKISNNVISMTRISTPELLENANKVDVNFNMIIKDKKTGKHHEFFEKHSMRYYFIPELEYLLSIMGFDPIDTLEYLKKHRPSTKSWNAITVSKKVK